MNKWTVSNLICCSIEHEKQKHQWRTEEKGERKRRERKGDGAWEEKEKEGKTVEERKTWGKGRKNEEKQKWGERVRRKGEGREGRTENNVKQKFQSYSRHLSWKTILMFLLKYQNALQLRSCSLFSSPVLNNLRLYLWLLDVVQQQLTLKSKASIVLKGTKVNFFGQGVNVTPSKQGKVKFPKETIHPTPPPSRSLTA